MKRTHFVTIIRPSHAKFSRADIYPYIHPYKTTTLRAFLKEILSADVLHRADASSRDLRASASDMGRTRRVSSKSLFLVRSVSKPKLRFGHDDRELRSLKIRAWTATLSLPPFAGGFHDEASVRRPVGVSPWPKFVLRARVSCSSPRPEPRKVSFWRRNGVLAAESSSSSFLALLQLEMTRARTRTRITVFLARRRA